MSRIIRVQLKKALVLLCAMLIFLQMIPCGKALRVSAAWNYVEDDDDEEEDDDIEIEEDDEDDDEDDDDEVDDDEDNRSEDEKGAYQKAYQEEMAQFSKKQKEIGDGQASDKQSSGQKKAQRTESKSNDSKSSEAAKKNHRKLTVSISSSKPKYYDKMSVGDELRLTVKSKKKKVNNKYLKFSSNKKSVATVSGSGVITAKKNGSARIKVINKKKKNQKCFIYITVAKNTVRTLFIGDSRTVDMFSGTADSVLGEVHNSVVVCAQNGGGVSFLNEVISHSDLSDYDTIITWMGCNDRGAFKPYSKTYSKMVSQNKKLVLCSVGPTNFFYMDEGGQALFNDRVISSFNRQLKEWAGRKKVKTVAMYEYVSGHVSIDTKDGVHYSPKPNKTMWTYILKNAQ